MKAEGASDTVGKYVGETVDSVISGAAAVFAGKSPFGGGRSKASSFFSWVRRFSDVFV